MYMPERRTSPIIPLAILAAGVPIFAGSIALGVRGVEMFQKLSPSQQMSTLIESGIIVGIAAAFVGGVIGLANWNVNRMEKKAEEDFNKMRARYGLPLYYTKRRRKQE